MAPPNSAAAPPAVVSSSDQFHFSTGVFPTGATDFYPASGCRTSNSGGLFNVGTGGYSWSSSPNSSSSVSGSGLNFHSGNVNPEYGNNRANGFPVRCVAE